jgi:hypothetical protein
MRNGEVGFQVGSRRLTTEVTEITVGKSGGGNFPNDATRWWKLYSSAGVAEQTVFTCATRIFERTPWSGVADLEAGWLPREA